MKNSDHQADKLTNNAADACSSATPLDVEEALETLLEACDEALAHGQDPAPLMEQLANYPPHIRREFTETLACLRVLKEKRRHSFGDPAPQRFGKFLLHGILGQGGFGTVWLAEDTVLCRRIALKVPRLHSLVAPEAAERFVREAKAAAALDHPNLISLFEIGELQGVSYLAMAYCEGPSLAQWLSAHQRAQSLAVAAALVATLARAVAYMHERNIVHRDLKPSNVLLFPTAGLNKGRTAPAAGSPPDHLHDYIPKITDFGLAHCEDASINLTRSGALLGTPAYMAPEQAWGGDDLASPGADIYSLGAILYELITGQPPFRGPCDLETLRAAKDTDPVSPRRLRSDIPRDLETICLKCLEKNSRKRYASAAALAEELERFLRHEPIMARRPPFSDRVRKWARRRPTLAGMTGLSCVAIGLLVAAFAWYGARAEIQQQDFAQESARRQVREDSLRKELGGREYVKSFRQAWQEWSKNAPNRALTVLTPLNGGLGPDPRGFEWYFLMNRAKRAPKHLGPAGISIYNMALSADGKLLALAHFGGAIDLWDTVAWKKIGALRNSDSVYGLALSPDGKLLAASGFGKTGAPELKLHDIVARKEVAQLALDGRDCPFAAFSPDGASLGAVVADRAYFWETSAPYRRQVTQPFNDGAPRDGLLPTYGLVWPPKGSGPIFWRNGSILDYDRNVERVSERRSVEGQIHSLARSPDGKFLAVACDQGVFIYPEKKVLQQPAASSLAWRRDGKVLAAAGFDGCTYLWDTATWQRLDQFLGAGDKTRLDQFKLDHRVRNQLLTGIVFLPDGKTLVSAGEDGLVKFWDTSRPELSAALTHDLMEPWSPIFSPDGQTIIAVGNQILFWDVGTKRALERLDDHGCQLMAAALSRNGKVLATGDVKGVIRVWDVPLDRSQRPRCKVLTGHQGSVLAVDVSSDGSTIASGGDDGTVRLWDAATGAQLRRFAKEKEAIFAVAFHPRDKVLATGGTEMAVKLWDVATGQLLVTQREDERVRRLAFSPDGATLAVGLATKVADASIMLRKGDTLERLAELSGHAGVVRSLAFSPDGSRLASGADDHLIKLWHVPTGQELLTIDFHAGGVTGLAFSPDGQTLLSCSHDHSVRLWNAPR